MRTPLALSLALPLSAATLASAARAQECSMPLRFYEDAPRVADIDAAPVRDALDAGRYDEAARLARARLDATSLEERAAAFTVRPGLKFNEEEVRVALAAAVIRTGGLEGLAAPVSAKLGPKKAKAAQARNLENARSLLQQELMRQNGDPVIATLLGEAHLALGNAEFAGRVLEDLAEADLIVSPEGWSALARARDAAGKSEEAAAARKRCEDSARDSAVCQAPAAAARS